MLPMQRRRKLLVEHLADETLIYDETRHQAHCLNRAAALVWRHCDGRTTTAHLAELLRSELKAPVSEDAVLAALDGLARAHLLEAGSVRPAPTGRVSRRRAAGQLAAAGAAAIVASITAPTAAQAASVGDCCTSVSQCRAGLNCVGHSHPECRQCPDKCCV